MDGLLVVHPEMGYLDSQQMGRKLVRKNRRLFDDIAAAIGDCLQEGNRVYYLGEESRSPDSELVYPPIRANVHRVRYISARDGYEQQLLVAKEQSMTDRLGLISVCGVSYEGCVSDIHSLLLGQENPLTPQEDYRRASRTLGWSAEQFARVFHARLNARIREELTDKEF